MKKIKIPQKFIEDTLDKFKLPFKHYPAKNTYQICNPFVDDRDFHMGLNYELQVYHCFKTSDKGSLLSFFSKVTKLPEQAITERLKKYYNIIESHKQQPVKQSEIVYHTIPSDWRKVENSGAITKMHYRYLISRNITREKIYRNTFYYSSMNTSRIIIPYLYNSCLVYWTSRDILNKVKKRYLYPEEKVVKNLKSDLLYNIDYCNKDNLIICEGQLNALVVDGVSIGGTEISDRQMKTIIELQPKKLTLALDQDMPGKTAIIKNAKRLYNYFKDFYYMDSSLTNIDFADVGESVAREFIDKYSKLYTPTSIFETEVKLKLSKKN